MLWGARTSARHQLAHVNVAGFLFPRSRSRDCWAAFEPNNRPGQKLKRTTDFRALATALFGAKAEDASTCESTSAEPFSEQALGRLYIEIGIRRRNPAEFIIVRIGTPRAARVES